MLNLSLDSRALVQRLDTLPPAMQAVLKAKVTALTLKLQAHVVQDKLHGQVLNQRSGRLARSIANQVTSTNLAVVGRVFSSGDVKYAAIHEFGGLIRHPGGTAYFPGAGGAFGGAAEFISNAAAAGLMRNGAPLPRTAAHDIQIPERSFLRSALRDMAEEIVSGLKTAAVQGAKAALKRAA